MLRYKHELEQRQQEKVVRTKFIKGSPYYSVEVILTYKIMFLI